MSFGICKKKEGPHGILMLNLFGNIVHAMMKAEKRFGRFSPFQTPVLKRCVNNIRRETLLLKCF